jgi:hypothetical protein
MHRAVLTPRGLPFDQRVCRFELRPHRDDPKRIIDLMRRSGVELLVASGMHQDGWAAYPSKVCPPHPTMDRKFIAELVRLARQHDIMLLSWYNLRQNNALVGKRTGWEIIERKSGRSERETAAGFCTFSSPYRDFVIRYSKEILDQGFQGLWYDGSWPGSWSIPSCYCRYCRRAFREKAGREIPARINWNDSVFRQWVTWRYRRFDEFMTRLHDELVAHQPGAIVMMNHYNRPNINSTDPAEGTSWKNGVSIDVMKFPGGGGNENTSIMNRLHTTGFNARIVKAQCPHRFDVWEPGGTVWRSLICQDIENDKTHSILHGVWTLALGGVPWTACENTLTTRGKPDPAVMNEFKRRRPFIGGEPLTYCAIHYSQAARDYWAKDTPNAYYSEVYGLFQVATESHLLVDLILDKHLEDIEYARRYAVIALPNSACLSRKQVEVLDQFVAEGGTLLSTFETSLYSEGGERQKDFQLAEVFGTHYEATKLLTPADLINGNSIYARDNFPKEIHPIRIMDKGFASSVAKVVFFGANYTQVRTEKASKVFGVAYEYDPKGKPASYTKTRGVIEPDLGPAIVVNRFGKGRSIYLAPEVGRGFMQWPHPENRTLIARFMEMGKSAITVKAPKIVEVTAFWKEPGTLAVHLVNLPSNTNRPPVPPAGIAATHEIIPIRDIEVTIGGIAGGKVTLPVSGQKPKVRRSSGELTVRLPQLGYHEVVWISGLKSRPWPRNHPASR